MTKPSTNFFNKEVSGNSLEARFCYPLPPTSQAPQLPSHRRSPTTSPTLWTKAAHTKEGWQSQLKLYFGKDT